MPQEACGTRTARVFRLVLHGISGRCSSRWPERPGLESPAVPALGWGVTTSYFQRPNGPLLLVTARWAFTSLIATQRPRACTAGLSGLCPSGFPKFREEPLSLRASSWPHARRVASTRVVFDSTPGALSRYAGPRQLRIMSRTSPKSKPAPNCVGILSA